MIHNYFYGEDLWCDHHWCWSIRHWSFFESLKERHLACHPRSERQNRRKGCGSRNWGNINTGWSQFCSFSTSKPYHCKVYARNELEINTSFHIITIPSFLGQGRNQQWNPRQSSRFLRKTRPIPGLNLQQKQRYIYSWSFPIFSSEHRRRRRVEDHDWLEAKSLCYDKWRRSRWNVNKGLRLTRVWCKLNRQFSIGWVFQSHLSHL